MDVDFQVKEDKTPNVAVGTLVRTSAEGTGARCVFANGTTILVSKFLAYFIRPGDELRFLAPLETADASSQIYIRSTSEERRRDAFQAEIGYVAQPQKDKQGNLFVSAEVVGVGIGIRTISLPCEALRDYFYAGNRRRARDRQPSFYELLRVNANATRPNCASPLGFAYSNSVKAKRPPVKFAQQSVRSISSHLQNSALATTLCLMIPRHPRCFRTAVLVLCW